MNNSFEQILSSIEFYHLTSLLAAAVFFAMAGYRELKQENLQGLIFSALAVFFGCAHIFCLYNVPAECIFATIVGNLDMWKWLTVVLAPTLIALYLVLGIVSFFRNRVRVAMVKFYFGLTLLCYIFMLGYAWPWDVRGIIAIVWTLIWFNVELFTAQ